VTSGVLDAGPSLYSLINTLLKLGDRANEKPLNRFSGFRFLWKTTKAVRMTQHRKHLAEARC